LPEQKGAEAAQREELLIVVLPCFEVEVLLRGQCLAEQRLGLLVLALVCSTSPSVSFTCTRWGLSSGVAARIVEQRAEESLGLGALSLLMQQHAARLRAAMTIPPLSGPAACAEARASSASAICAIGVAQISYDVEIASWMAYSRVGSSLNRSWALAAAASRTSTSLTSGFAARAGPPPGYR